jgi:hypothetical protein
VTSLRVFTVAVGYTVMVNVIGVPVQALAVGVTVMVDRIVAVPELVGQCLCCCSSR